MFDRAFDIDATNQQVYKHVVQVSPVKPLPRPVPFPREMPRAPCWEG